MKSKLILQTVVALLLTTSAATEAEDANTPVEDFLKYRRSGATPRDAATRQLKFGDDDDDKGLRLRLRVRRSYDEAARGTTNGNELDEANPALFSYAHDLNSGADIWTARGAVALHSGSPIPKEVGPFSDVLVVPGISFDRIEANNDEVGEVNSLVFRIGANAAIGKKNTLHELRLNAMYATDFDLNSAIVGGEFDWEPKFLNLPGAELFNSSNGKIKRWRYRTILHSEFGEIVDTGGNPNLTEGESFFRVGPKLELEFDLTSIKWLGSKERPIELFGAYSYLWGIDGSPGSSYYLKLGSRFQLDDSGRLSIEASYEKGDMPLVAQEIDTITVALGLKF